MRKSYQDNYDQIARDHIAHWRETGVNPWQLPEHVAEMTSVTLSAVNRYSSPGAQVLDAGCAMGDLLLEIEDRDVYGCDFSRPYVEIARQRGLNVVYGELEHLPYPNERFDLVMALDILEHVLDLNIVVAELLRVLKPNGVLVVRSPDEEDLSPYLGPENPYQYVHLRRFDESSLRLLFTRIFECEVLETSVTRKERTIVVMKP